MLYLMCNWTARESQNFACQSNFPFTRPLHVSSLHPSRIDTVLTLVMYNSSHAANLARRALCKFQPRHETNSLLAIKPALRPEKTKHRSRLVKIYLFSGVRRHPSGRLPPLPSSAHCRTAANTSRKSCPGQNQRRAEQLMVSFSTFSLRRPSPDMSAGFRVQLLLSMHGSARLWWKK